MALAQDLEETLGIRVESMADDNGALIFLPRNIEGGPETALRPALLRLGEIPFRTRLESSGFFGASFREAAERSLLLPKASFGKRSPLWIMRQRSRRLFDAVSDYADFPVTAEAWRSCLLDQFDLLGFTGLIRDIRDGTLGFSFFRTRKASPFARDLLWKETNVQMYEYDGRPDLRGKAGAGKLSLGEEIIREALGNPAVRPPLPRGLVEDFCSRLRRELPLRTAEDERGLCEWVRERIAIPEDEWETLMAAVPAELREAWEADPGLGGRLLRCVRPGAQAAVVVHRELAEEWERDGLPRLGQWLRYEGPVSLSRIAGVFAVPLREAEAAVEALAEAGELVRDVTIAGAETEDLLCDRENLEILLRLARKKARPVVTERPATLLSPYLALRQGLIQGENRFPWQTLSCYAAPAALWESDYFAPRNPRYNPGDLDREIAGGRLLWYGAGPERIGFCAPEDLDLIPGGAENAGLLPAALPLEAAGPSGYWDRPRDFWEIREVLGGDTASCIQRLWDAAWEGRISADTFEPVRRGIEGGFIPKTPVSGEGPERGGPAPAFPGRQSFRRRQLPRALRERWRAGPPVLGRWFSLGTGSEDLEDEPDLLDEEERSRDKVRLLLDRWGLLARPLLEREAPGLSWARLLPAIRRLELSGELVAGRFFRGINSLQFASPAIGKELEAAEALGGIYWMNAADPASPAGLDIEGLDPRLPPRIVSARLCFRGPELIAVSLRSGRELRIFIPPEDRDIPAALEFTGAPRSGPARRKIQIETVNGLSAASSPYAGALKTLGFLPDRGKLIRW
jgi:ATP-dependent Lhr-like helicase